MNFPVLDSRNSQEILSEISKLASSYTPEWSFNVQNPDFGVVLAKIYSEMLMQTVNLYNKTPYNHYITFLNLLNTKLLPPASASGLVSVRVNPEVDGVYIKKGSLVYAAARNEEGRVFYQLSDSMYADSVQIERIICTNGSTDTIISIDEPYKPFRAFDTQIMPNLQKHIIYFRHDIVFSSKGRSNIKIKILNNNSKMANESIKEIFSDLNNIYFEYMSENEWKSAGYVDYCEDNTINLQFNDYTHFDEQRGFSIRCVFKKIPSIPLLITDIRCASSGIKIMPDALSSGDNDLKKSDFFPFSETFTLHDSFYVSCNDVFCKKGCKVTLNLEMEFINIVSDIQIAPPPVSYKNVMKQSDFNLPQQQDIKIKEVVWEYFNGTGWVRLFAVNAYSDFFDDGLSSKNKRLSFDAPYDHEMSSNGGFTGYFIRARILKLLNPYGYGANYISPFVHSLMMDYEYQDTQPKIQEITVYSNMVERRLNLNIGNVKPIFTNEMLVQPTMYFKLSKPISNGPIRVFFNIDDNIYINRPAIKWEYLANNDIWSSFDVSDKTNNFSSSAIVTAIGKKDFCKSSIFGIEGYFIRVIDNDNNYQQINSSLLPLINGIYINTVPLIQKTQKPAEYFFMESGERSKRCNLSFQSVCEIEVWVDENGHLSSNQLQDFVEDENKILEYDSLGKLNKLWIKWAQTESLLYHSSEERVFEIDNVKGIVLFGDGVKGKIPISQQYESIKVVYSTAGGHYGNIPENHILGFADSIAYVENVKNIKPIVGGVDMENIEQAAKRVSNKLLSMNRLVTLEDYENSIVSFDRRIRRVKCISHVNRFNEEKLGNISIAILPNEYMSGAQQFGVISENVEKFVSDYSGLLMRRKNSLEIFEVNYVEISVDILTVITDYNHYHQVHQDISSKLSKYINPITGNFDSKGFEIGSLPNVQSIYNCVKSVKNIGYIKKIDLFFKVITKEGKKDIDISQVANDIFSVPVFGEIQINAVTK